MTADAAGQGATSLRHGLNAVAFSPNEKALWGACSDRTVGQWSVPDVIAGEQFAHQGPADNVACSPDGRFLATSQTDGLVRVWKLPGSNPRERRLASVVGTPEVRTSPDGRWVTAVNSPWRWMQKNHTHCRIHDTATRLPAGPDLALDGFLTDVAFAPDGRTAAIVSRDPEGETGSLEFWDVRAGKRWGEPLPLPAQPLAIAYRSDGSQAAAFCADGAILLAEPADGRVVCRLRHECRRSPGRIHPIRSGNRGTGFRRCHSRPPSQHYSRATMVSAPAAAGNSLTPPDEGEKTEERKKQALESANSVR